MDRLNKFKYEKGKGRSMRVDDYTISDNSGEDGEPFKNGINGKGSSGPISNELDSADSDYSLPPDVEEDEEEYKDDSEDGEDEDSNNDNSNIKRGRGGKFKLDIYSSGDEITNGVDTPNHGDGNGKASDSSSDDSIVCHKRRTFASRKDRGGPSPQSGSGSAESDDQESSSSDDSLPAEPSAAAPGKKPRRRRVKMMSQSSEGSARPGDAGSCESEEEEAGERIFSRGSSSAPKEKRGKRGVTMTAEQRQSATSFIASSFPDLTVQDVKRLLIENEWDLCKASDAAELFKKASDTYGLDCVDEDPSSGAVPDGFGKSSGKKKRKGPKSANKVKIPKSKKKADPMDFKEEFIDSDDISDEELEIPEDKIPDIITALNEETLTALKNAPEFSLKKAMAVIESRPFEDWDNVVYKFTSVSLLYPAMLEGLVSFLFTRDRMNSLMNRCQAISDTLESDVAELKEGKKELEIATQPAILITEMQLKPYQMIGLNWLNLMHRHHVDGILADEMGLGKTAQTIAFLAHLLETEPQNHHHHLIVVPGSTLENWEREVNMWCPTLVVAKYYGSPQDRAIMRKALFRKQLDFNILLTTYNMITSTADDRMVYKKVVFEYAVFDEGHMLKNMQSQRYQNLIKIRSARRLLLTGTPLQNNLIELMSLLCFVVPGVFDGKESEVIKVFACLPTTAGEKKQVGSKYERERIEHAKTIMRPFILRRLKKDVLTQLPTKHESIHHCPLAARQSHVYESVRSQMRAVCKENEKVTQALLEEDLEGKADGQTVAVSAQPGDVALNTIEVELTIETPPPKKKRGRPKKCEETKPVEAAGSQQPPALLGMLFDLRKVANHHLLIRYIYTDTVIGEMAAKIAAHPDFQHATERDWFEDLSVRSDFEIRRICSETKVLKEWYADDISQHMSGKFEYLNSVLPTMKKNGDKVLIFSQFTKMMDILEEFLEYNKHTYLRLDGSTKMCERQERMDKFNDMESGYFVFLLSTRAGGLGINLTSANVVIIHDLDYNPYNDKQAEDRCHRVGQTREVRVIRLVGKDTVEEAILAIATAKLDLEKDITTNEEEDGSSKVQNMAKLLKQALG